MAPKIVETPLMKQYFEMKDKHPDAILLFRVGDFYETFSKDAIEASRILGITLTHRANGTSSSVELAGFPHHALDNYLPRLVQEGKRVAICEQLEDPKLTKKLVKRGITELVTPGVNINDNMLSARENNFLAGLHFGKKTTGIAFLDISTGEFLCAAGDDDYVGKLIANIAPKEILVMHGLRSRAATIAPPRQFFFELDDWIYTPQAANERLLRQFGTTNLKGFGVDDTPEGVIAAASLLYYLDSTCHTRISHITALAKIDSGRFVRLDRFTVRNLEITTSLGDEGKSLIDILDKTSAPQGARLLRRWLHFPLRDIAEITRRHSIVEYFFRNPELHTSLQHLVTTVGDLERVISKVAVGRVSPRDLTALAQALTALEAIARECSESDSAELKDIAARIDSCPVAIEKITHTIAPDAPSLLSRGNFIAPGVNAELDDLRNIASSGKDYLNAILSREVQATGIPSLKISFNNVFGYYIEVRNTHRDKVPPEWIRKQTLVNAERYITPELKEYEQKILGAQERIAVIENSIFSALVDSLAEYIPAIQRDAAAIAETDCLLAFAQSAKEYRYVRPVIDDSLVIDIRNGRHPVIERRLPPGEEYVANSLRLDNDECQIMMITGPNMSGKSALLRQTALIALMAQAGSFVPAEAATIGIVDKIFTRVGASDNISQGESTFMVEMNEAASILNNISDRSLILFDELGRGTSTYDGISIAWAIVEHLHDNGRCKPKTLFATHYHELNEMERSFRRIRNFNVAVDEVNGKVVFLRKLRPGGSEHSFGIHVAKLAGMPPSIVRRASQVLRQLESASCEVSATDKQSAGGVIPEKIQKADVASIASARDGYQLSFFQLDDPLLSQIRTDILSLDIDNLTPMQALTTLNTLKSLLLGK